MFVSFVLFLGILIIPQKSESGYCVVLKYMTVKDTSGGLFGWSLFSSTVYKVIALPSLECCEGYGGTFCLFPICGGGPTISSCSVQEGYYKVSNSETIYVSGGTCTAPGVCENCNPGYYGNIDTAPYQEAFCRACKAIDKCDQPRCTTGTYTQCDKCSGEPYREHIGRNAFTGKPDITRCQETCSWVSGKRCYPGTCDNNMLFSSCSCSDGFTGADCATFESDNLPEIYEQMFELRGSGEIPYQFLDRSNAESEKVWTRQLIWNDVSLKVSASYTPNYVASVLARDYISSGETKVGVQNVQSSIVWKRGSNEVEWLSTLSCGFESDCTISVQDSPIDDIQPWYSTYRSLVFQHADTILFTASTTNGGKVTYIDWENGQRKGSYYLNGVSFTRTMELGIDAVPPYHESALLADITQATTSPVITPEFSVQKVFDVSWGGWADDLSGLQSYEFNTYLLQYADNSLQGLTSPRITKIVNVSSNVLQTELFVEENGPHAVEITAYDRAGNYETARRLLMVDDSSIVDIQGEQMKVTQANSKHWINEITEVFEVRWPDRFINKRHVANHWLEAVQDGGFTLDDRHDISERNTTAIHNINGIVRCEVGRSVTLDGNTWDVGYTPVPQDYFDEEKMEIDDEECIDGKKINFKVIAYDVMGASSEDNVTAMIDTSPPVLENLWLTNGDYLNLSVHSVLELNDLIIEWEVYDEHSGIYEVSWRLFDNYTKNEILHGHSDEPPKGGATSLDDCNTMYSDEARGAKCYTTPYSGSYHKHYQIKPQITNLETGGILHSRTNGEHDSDYYIEVTANNNANLTTVSYHKITIDTSPPHAGVVHDGTRGLPEVDYQQSTTLSAHWDDFFDKESSVWFYLYAFDSNCLLAEDFDIHNIDGITVHKTYETSAEFTVPSEGTYFVTVVAYNHALDGSVPVCSDGVTIDSVPVDVTEIVISGATIRRGLLQDANSGTIYLLSKQREIKEVINPTASQIGKSTSLQESIINTYPMSRFLNGAKMTVNGENLNDDGIIQFSDNPATLISFDSHLTVSWNASTTLSGVHDFEVGLSTHESGVPDIMDYTTTHHHRFKTIQYPNVWDGVLFDILIRTTTKSGISSVKTIGPIQVDRTPPEFEDGSLTVTKEYDNDEVLIIAKWTENSFQDDIDPNPLSFSIALGSYPYGKDIKPFSGLEIGGSCTHGQTPTCSAIAVSSLAWSLHGKQKYYATVKAENTAGLFVLGTSQPYFHNVELASKGVVFDVDINDQNTLQDIDDIDFQTDTTSLSTRWRSFLHPHEDVSFIVSVYDDLDSEALTSKTVTDATDATFTGLYLQPYTTYYQTVTAVTEAGNTTATSDGVTVIIENDNQTWLMVFDGPAYSEPILTNLDLDRSHHTEDKRLGWINDLVYQSSTNTLQAHWEIPEDKAYFIKDMYWALEEKAPVTDYWTLFRDYEHLKSADSLEANDLVLSPGRMYRVLLKCCVGKYCYMPAHSNGVTVTPNPPRTGTLSVEETGTNNFVVEFDAFIDTDIEDESEQPRVMDHYEWAVTDALDHGQLVTKWERADISNIYENQISVAFSKDVAFTKCWKLAVRGYTQAGLSSVVTAEVKNCSDINEVRPNVVIDAFGVPLLSSEDGHEGQSVYLEENEYWPLPDVDYTPYHNVLSAVWPTLRHKNYTWAVLTWDVEDPLTFYHTATDLTLSDPCSHPDAIKCGETVQGFSNAYFETGELQHGHRYITCVHAPPSQIEHEFWIQVLDEVNICSDGVTLDLTPPTAADVWIGNDKSQLFQTSTSDISTHWNSFSDVEELGLAAHSSGIAYYEVAIGTSAGGNDVVDFTNVGLTNHKTFHQLPLKQGHTYFATVRAYDFVNQTSQSISNAMKVDTTPPVDSGRTITIPSRYITDSQYVSACWSNVFEDKESGISHYEWCVGTSAGYSDVMDYIVTTDECSQTSVHSPLDLIEGHSYFVSVKAYNNAGLWHTATSFAFTVDESPPVAGNVFDVDPDNVNDTKDADYTTSTTRMAAHWTAFHDPHSTIIECYVSVGTCAGCEDVKRQFPVGLTQNVDIPHLHLVEGVKYYISVTAKNAAGLVTMAASDGVIVDTTPPIPGHVTDGIYGNDIQYQSSRKVVACKWYGFNDPQSSISHYEWRLGTTRGGEDILSNRDVHKSLQGVLSDYHMLTGQSLPTDTRIFCTVRAYNKAGMYTEASSNGFIIDTSPPVFLQDLTQSSIGSVTPGTSVLRSFLRVSWEVQDEESSIEFQYLSIASHIGGDFNSSLAQVPGHVRDHSFTDLNLHDGSFYDVKLISCNGAKLCTSSVIENILVDSTPPTAGAFAINTDHAAALQRQPDDWMTWTPVSLKLSWLGFQDIHSGVLVYSINVGSSFMGDDLNLIYGEPFTIDHISTGSYLEDGTVQTHEIFLQPLSRLTSIYISIKATNKVGLMSSILHGQFRLEHGRLLALVRRCDRHSCLGHCVCAPHGEFCDKEDALCTEGPTDEYARVVVQDYINLDFQSSDVLTYTPINTMLAAQWSVIDFQRDQPLWFEFSVGESSYDTPTGIFNTALEKVWHEVGTMKYGIVTLAQGRELITGVRYSFFIKAWYTANHYIVYKTPGVIIKPSHPKTTDIRGRRVKEVVHGMKKDIDFVTSDLQFEADWEGKFINTDDSIAKFHLYLSTFPGGHDAHIISTDLSPDTVKHDLTGLPLLEYTKYYTVVQAISQAGLHTTVVSDGFMLDSYPPTAGAVFDGKVINQRHAKSSNASAELFWHGFSDSESGVVSYEYCVSRIDSTVKCDVEPYQTAGVKTRAEVQFVEPVEHGTTLIGSVRAYDAAGYVSEEVTSQGVMIDLSPPIRATVEHCDDNIVMDSEFNLDLPVDLTSGEPLTCQNGFGDFWALEENSCACVVKTDIGEGNALILSGTVFQTISNLSMAHGNYVLTFYTSAVAHSQLLQSVNEGVIDINGDRHSFITYLKPVNDGYFWQKHSYRFDINTDSILLRIGTLNRQHVIAFKDITLENCLVSDIEFTNSTGHVNSHTVFLHDWSSIHADWNFRDKESEIVEYLWAIGTIPGGTQLQGFVSVGRRTFASHSSLNLVHDSVVYVTVVAVNAAGLRTVSYSNQIIIDLTPPVFQYVHDGDIQGEDVSYQRELVVGSRWKVDDPESGIVECIWGLGNYPGDTSIVEYTPVDLETTYMEAELMENPNVTIYATVKCTNGANLTSSAHSDGIIILDTNPSLSQVVLEVMGHSKTQYPIRGHYHGDTSEIRFRWSGFSAQDGIESVLVSIEGDEIDTSELVTNSPVGFTYASFDGLSLVDGNYTISIIALNEVQMSSEKLSEEFILLTRSPELTGNGMTMTWTVASKRVICNWATVFRSTHPLYYEVTVRLSPEGEGDLLQWQETTNTLLDIEIDTTELPDTGANVVFSVRAIGPSGLFVTVHEEIPIS